MPSPRARGRPRDDLSERAYTKIRRDIVSGRYGLGCPLPARRLSEMLGMSPLPVLRALQRLQTEGLVETKPRAGTRVIIPSGDMIRGLYAVREALEIQAARLCAERATAPQRSALLRLARAVDAADWRGVSQVHSNTDRRRANFLHASLHRRIAEYAGCVPLLEEIERSQVLTFKIQFDHAALRRLRPPHWHEALVQAITAGDPDAAGRAMRTHIESGMIEALNLIENLNLTDGWRR